METVMGFVAGYLVGIQEGRDGLQRIRTSVQSIINSPEMRKLAGEAVTLAQATVKRAASGTLGETAGEIAETLARRAVSAAAQQRSRAA
jgi:hypothetical protein